MMQSFQVVSYLTESNVRVGRFLAADDDRGFGGIWLNLNHSPTRLLPCGTSVDKELDIGRKNRDHQMLGNAFRRCLGSRATFSNQRHDSSLIQAGSKGVTFVVTDRHPRIL
ncbi:unnamed protein product [Cylindrotheca closterium]|uniref:Uncharacterized protein n=1 Tax=Cylindrotheca closterium TaxID=2856 RepID=A0AAD2FTI4_9STRA|nr:unnamed protein product [Cylindrotheca closterium]